MEVATEARTAPASEEPAPAPPLRWETVARFAAAVAGAITVHFGWQFWMSGKLFIYHEIAAMDLLVYAVGFMLFWLALVDAPRWRRWTGPLILAAVVLTTVTGVYVWTHSVLSIYGTDDIAFQHYSATLVLRGIDPYAVSMRPALERFHMPLQFSTLLQNGTIIDRVSWPAGSFLIFVPFVALGVSDVRWVVLLFHLAATGVVYFATPVRVRPLVLLPVFGAQELIEFTGGGVVDFPWVVPVLLMVIWRRRPALMGLCYGVACGIKQVPWFLAPFLLVYLFKDSKNRVHGTRQRLVSLASFAVPAIAVFLGINAPFIVHDPVNWILGTLAPAIGNPIPFGQGPSTLTQLGFPVPTDAYVIMTAAIAFLLLINYVVYFRQLRNLMWFFPALIAWFLPRSLHNYFVFWIPIMALVLGLEAATPVDIGTHAV